MKTYDDDLKSIVKLKKNQILRKNNNLMLKTFLFYFFFFFLNSIVTETEKIVLDHIILCAFHDKHDASCIVMCSRKCENIGTNSYYLVNFNLVRKISGGHRTKEFRRRKGRGIAKF